MPDTDLITKALEPYTNAQILDALRERGLAIVAFSSQDLWAYAENAYPGGTDAADEDALTAFLDTEFENIKEQIETGLDKASTNIIETIVHETGFLERLQEIPEANGG